MKKFFRYHLTTLFLSTLYLLLFTFAYSQSGWGPDVRLTYLNEGTVYKPRIAVSGDTLHIVWYQRFIVDTVIVIEVMYKRSTDRGETWTQDTILSPLSPGASNMPEIAVSGSTVHVAWDEEVGDSVLYIRSTDGGMNWTAPITITQAGFNPLVGVHGDTVFIKWGTTTGSYYKLSYNGGVSWSPQYQIPRQPLSDRKVQINGSYIHLSPEGYPTDTSVIFEVFHQYSSDCGQSWSQPVMLSEQDIWHSFGSVIAIEEDSMVYVDWTDGKNTPYPYTGNIFLRVSSNYGASWDTIQNMTTLYRAKRPDIATQGDDVHVVWMDDRDYPGSPPFDSFEIYYRYSSDRGNTWGPETRLTYDPNDSEDPRLAVDAGFVYLVWADNRDLDSIWRGYEVYFKRGNIEVGIEAEKDIFLSLLNFQILSSICRDEVRCYCDLSKSQDWTIDIFDILGRKVWEYSGTGKRVWVMWGCKDKRGEEVRTGVYFVRLRTEGKSYQQKVIILKGG